MLPNHVVPYDQLPEEFRLIVSDPNFALHFATKFCGEEYAKKLAASVEDEGIKRALFIGDALTEKINKQAVETGRHLAPRPFLPGDRIERGDVILYRQLRRGKTYCVRDCVNAGYFDDGRARWLVGVVGVDGKGHGTEGGRFWSWQLKLVIRPSASSANSSSQ